MKKIDVLWLLEHNAREMDIACAVKSLMQARYSSDIRIQNIYLHTNEVMDKYLPRLIVLPFLYLSSDLAIEDYLAVWPHAKYFNLAMEQVHYKAHLKMKAPGDEFSRKRVIHHAWGTFYKNYLIESGVPSNHIFVNGNPVYQLYKKPYCKYFKSRESLAQQNKINPAKKWIFIPENYKWAFFSDDKLKASAARGGNLDEHFQMREFCRSSLAHLLEWCNQAGRNDELEIIFRPRPATNSLQMKQFFEEKVEIPTKNLHFTKVDSVRDWILASDLVVSSYSTSLIEAAVAGKPIYMVEPIPIPVSLYNEWYEFVPRIYNNSGFLSACLDSEGENYFKLQKWAQDEMLSNGDPLQQLADYVATLVNSSRNKDSIKTNIKFTKRYALLSTLVLKTKWRLKRMFGLSFKSLHSLLFSLRLLAKIFIYTFLPPRNKVTRKRIGTVGEEFLDGLRRSKYHLSQILNNTDYFNPITHENDAFTEMDVNNRVDRWRVILQND